jgi:uncharacterized Tic20 family protein
MAEAPPQINPDEKNLALLAHILGFITCWMAPLIIYLTATEKPFAKQQAQEALNFQITMLMGYLASAFLTFVVIGYFTGALLGIANLVFCIMGAVAVSNGKAYRYPFALRLIR